MANVEVSCHCIDVQEPAAGYTFRIGQAIRITWQSACFCQLRSVDIELYQGNVKVATVAVGQPSSGSILWATNSEYWYTLTIRSTNFGAQAVGAIVQQTVSGAIGTLKMGFSGQVTTLVVISTNDIPFDTASSVSITSSTGTTATNTAVPITSTYGFLTGINGQPIHGSDFRVRVVGTHNNPQNVASDIRAPRRPVVVEGK